MRGMRPLPEVPRSPYFASATVDFLAVGGLSILAYFGFRLGWRDVGPQDVLQFIVLYLVWLGNAPHFAATCYRLYRSPATMRQYPFTAALVPVLVLAMVYASLLLPTRIAPWFIKLYLLWSPFHYSGQTVGITLAYCRRGGIQLGPWERRALVAAVYATFIASAIKAEAALTEIIFFGIKPPALGAPKALSVAADWAMWAALAAFALYVAWRWAKRRAPLPWIALVPVLAQFFWFVPGAGLPAYFQTVPLFHGVQYLLVAWHAQMRERAVAGAGAVAWETGKWAVAVGVGGVLLFWALPQLLGLTVNRSIFFVMPVAIAGVQVHHFFVDGVIWKLRDPRVAAVLVETDGKVGA